MRLLRPTTKQGRAWWSLWMQNRRRSRLNVETPQSPLLTGLMQFYLPQSGVTHYKSWNEPEALVSNPFIGLVTPTEDLGSGSYGAGDFIQYQLHPFRESGPSRVYAGVVHQKELTLTSGSSGVLWPPWGATPGWVTGFAMLRFLNASYAGYRVVTLAALLAGWTDSGTGWSSSGALPVDFNSPPTTAKVVWNVQDEYSLPQAVSVVASPLGGWAFDATLGDKLVRALSDDLRRNVDGTMTYWMCPDANTSGVLSSLRGIFTGNMGGNYTCAAPDVSFGDTALVNVPDHQDGDWYLVVIRRDDLADAYQKDLVRLRDGAQFATVDTLEGANSTVLTDAEDYFLEGIWGVLVFGSSFHWSQQGYAYYDRLAMWDRALSNDEVLDLFNNGLGWQPS